MENLFLHEVLNVNLFIIDCFKGKVSRSVSIFRQTTGCNVDTVSIESIRN